MQIDEQLILKLESLARLELAADERIKLLCNLMRSSAASSSRAKLSSFKINCSSICIVIF